MTIGQAKAKPYWFALCLTDVFIFLQLDTPLFVAVVCDKILKVFTFCISADSFYRLEHVL